MAAKLNTKFLLLLVTLVVGVGLAIAAIAWFTLRDDPARNLRRAERAMERGDLDAAELQFQRALNKRKTDLQIIGDYESLLDQMYPHTENRANELYGRKLMLMNQRVVVQPQNLEFQLERLEEMYRNAVVFPAWWPRLAEVAEEAMGRVALEDVEAIIEYKLMADAQRYGELDTQAEIDQLEAEYVQFIEQNPEKTRAAAILVNFLNARGREFMLNNDSRSAADRFSRAKQVLATIEAASTENDIHTAVASARVTLVDRARDPASFDQSRMASAADRLEIAMTRIDDPIHYIEAMRFIQAVAGLDGLNRMIAIIQSRVSAQPNALLERWLLASMYFDTGEIDRAEEEAKVLLKADPLPVGLLAAFSFSLDKRAAKLLFDVQRVRVDQADAATQEQAVQELVRRRDAVAELFGGSEDDPTVAECDGWIAIARRDYRTAVARFNHVVQAGDPSTDLLWAHSQALQKVGSLGEAHSYVERVDERSPGNVMVLLELARLELELGRTDEARQHINDVLAIEPENATAFSLRTRLGGDDPSELGDDATRIRLAAAEAFHDNDLDTCYSILVAGLERYPADWGIFEMLVRTELIQGKTEQAISRLEAKEGELPGDPRVVALLERARGSDPVDAQMRIVAAQHPDSEADRTIALYVALRTLAERERERAATLSPAEAGAAESIARRADAEANKAADRAGQLLDSSHRLYPDYLDRRFRDALNERNLAEAERLAELARQTNADQARGLMFSARLAIARQDWASTAIILEDAAVHKPYDVWIHRTLGSVYTQLGNQVDARRAFTTAMELNPADLQTISRYGQFLISRGENKDALELFRKAAAMLELKEVRDVQEQWLVLEAAAGDPSVALRERLKRLETHPDDRANAIRLAGLFGSVEPTREWIVDDSGTPRFDAFQWQRATTSARAVAVREQREKWVARADQILTRLLADEEDLQTVLAYATHLRNTGRTSEGIDSVVAYGEKHAAGAGSDLYIGIAQYLSSSGEWDGAIEWLNRGLPTQSPEREIDEALSAAHFELRRFEDGYRHLVKVYEARPSETLARQLIEYEVNLRRFADAETKLNALLNDHPNDYLLWLLKSGISGGRAAEALSLSRHAEAQKHLKEQQQHIDQAIALSQDDPVPHLMKAQSILTEYRRGVPKQPTLLADALTEISRATQKRPGFAPALSLGAEIHLESVPPDHQNALANLREILRATPRDVATRRRAVEICVEFDRIPRAVELLEQAIDLDPANPAWYRSLSQLHVDAGDVREAANVLRQSYESTGSEADLASWGELLLSVDRSDARRAVIEEISARASDFDAMPPLQTVLARALAAEGRRAEALEQLRNSFPRFKAVARQSPAAMQPWFAATEEVFSDRPVRELEEFVFAAAGGQPDVADLHRVGRAWLHRDPDGVTRALELFEQALVATQEEETGDRAQLLMLIGEAHVKAGSYEQSAQAYERAAEYRPDDPRLLNNIAYIYGVELGQPDKALPMAEAAVRLSPDNPQFLDTLGAVYHKMGRLEEAEERLRQALTHDKRAVFHVRLAEVLIAQDRRQDARLELLQARNLDPDPETQEQIRRLLDDIAN